MPVDSATHVPRRHTRATYRIPVTRPHGRSYCTTLDSGFIGIFAMTGHAAERANVSSTDRLAEFGRKNCWNGRKADHGDATRGDFTGFLCCSALFSAWYPALCAERRRLNCASHNGGTSVAHTICMTIYPVYVVSGEGEGPGAVREYSGVGSHRALAARLTREVCGGDRWAYLATYVRGAAEELLLCAIGVERAAEICAAQRAAS